jgi:hypothetical protein
MVCFQTKNSNLGKIWKALKLKKVAYYLAIWEYICAIWYILWPFGNLVAIWYIRPCFGILNKEQSGNPALRSNRFARKRQFLETV